MIAGVFVASNKTAALYGYARLVELMLFGLGARVVLQAERKVALQKIAFVFAVGMLFSSFIAINQFVHQASLGGLFYFIGERTFSSETPGIANVAINGELFMRPYASFPHPNVLAWYLFVGIAFCIGALIKQKQTHTTRILLATATFVGIGTIFLTLSRSVIVCLIAFILLSPLFLLRKAKKEMLLGFYCCMSVLIIGIYFLTPLGGRMQEGLHIDKSIRERQQLFASALSMTRAFPLVGVGTNNFLVRLPDYSEHNSRQLLLQPVHNMYVLTLVEEGVVGVGLFLFVLWNALSAASRIISRTLRYVCNSLLIAALLLGTVDHYLITLEQGQILFVFILTLCFAMGAKKRGVTTAR